MRSNVLEAITGAVVLTIAGLFFFFAYSSSGTKIENGYYLVAKFDRIDGLLQGNDVKVGGVKIGRVHSITIDPDTYLAVVTMLIENFLKLPTDSSAQIASESLMGGKYVALVPGGDEENLKSGESIIHTQSAISFESLIGKFLFSKVDGEEPSSQETKGQGDKGAKSAVEKSS